MNKAELIDKIAARAGLSKAAAARALDAATSTVRASLKKSEQVRLIGFGTFTVGKRAARLGRNPRTGATIKIKATRVVKFKPGKELQGVALKSR